MFTLRLLARERFPPADDDVAVEGVEFHQEGAAPGALGGDERAPAAAEEVEDAPGLLL